MSLTQRSNYNNINEYNTLQLVSNSVNLKVYQQEEMVWIL